MPSRFHRLTLEEFLEMLNRFSFTRRITGVHMHHTWRPNHSQDRGLATIEAMWRFHTQTQGWSDIAQHITIDKEGAIWTGRNWNAPPVSAKGFNGNSTAGPFMFEMIGDFDTGRDPFDGAQKESALKVIAHVQQRFDLPVETLRFHNQMASKSCPGSAIRYDDVLAEVRQLREALISAPTRGRRARAAPSNPPPFPDDALEIHARVEAALQAMAQAAAPRDLEGEANAEPRDEQMTEAERAFFTEAGVTRPTLGEADQRGARSALTAEMLDALRPHVINLNQGQFSSEGQFSTDAGDINAIFEQHLERALEDATEQKPLRLVFYAHGGLVSEESGLGIAHKHVEWWKANGIYPINFVWETGLLETLGQMLRGARERTARDLADFTTDPALEFFVRTVGGGKIWSGMKRSAELAVAEGGGARFVATRLKEFCDRHAAEVAAGKLELHAVGHSAGSIFHSHFVPAALALGTPKFHSMHFLAPAIRVDEFHDRLFNHIGNGIEHLSIFTMAKSWEQDDNCMAVYRKSLLYLIYYALENARKTDILGLEISLRGDEALKGLLGLGSQPSAIGEVIWSVSQVTAGRNASTSTTHGGFDDDPPTMNSVLRRIKSLTDTDPLESEFPGGARDLDLWASSFDWPEEFSPFKATLKPSLPAVPETPGLPAKSSPVIAAPSVATSATDIAGGGQRLALCVGINSYPLDPLGGCVADARSWAAALQQLDFRATLLLDGDATREGIMQSLKNLISNSRAGDVLVFQFAGHGTQLNDLNGDEDSDGKDEALCPVDFRSTGQFVIDDDLRELFEATPAGVNLTCFIDCCHSGTITRLAVGATTPVGGRDRRARFVRATPEMEELHKSFRTRQGLLSPPKPFGPEGMKNVLFSACKPNEVAFESDGHGDFTVRAAQLLVSSAGQVTHAEFQERITAAFGAGARQNPNLDCAKPARQRLLLTPLTGDDRATASRLASDNAHLAQALRLIADSLDKPKS